MEAMLSGSPLLFLDLRDRTLLGKVPDRATLLAQSRHSASPTSAVISSCAAELHALARESAPSARCMG